MQIHVKIIQLHYKFHEILLIGHLVMVRFVFKISTQAITQALLMLF